MEQGRVWAGEAGSAEVEGRRDENHTSEPYSYGTVGTGALEWESLAPYLSTSSSLLSFSFSEPQFIQL